MGLDLPQKWHSKWHSLSHRLGASARPAAELRRRRGGAGAGAHTNSTWRTRQVPRCRKHKGRGPEEDGRG